MYSGGILSVASRCYGPVGNLHRNHGSTRLLICVDSLLSAELEQEGSATEGRTSSDGSQVRLKDPEADSPAAKKRKVEVQARRGLLSVVPKQVSDRALAGEFVSAS